MNEYAHVHDEDGGGCLLWLLLVLGVGIGLVLAGGGARGGTTETLARNLADNQLLSQNQVEAFSRNQVNLFSDVRNCYDAYSCAVVITQTVQTVGDRNRVNVAAPATCLDPTTGAYTSSACAGVYAGTDGTRP